MSSITVTLTGNSSSLNAHFHPEIELNEQSSYSCSLLDFHTYNSIPNVYENNNKFHFLNNETGQTEKIRIPVGSYEISDIATYLQSVLGGLGITFNMKGNKNTLKCVIETDITIDFTKEDSIGSILGFDKRVLSGEKMYKSDRIVNIYDINTIRIDCDLTSGSFHNGKHTHTIYEFSPSVNPGYKINEQPRNLIYLPIVRRRIGTLNISIVDQYGTLIDFRGETITCRLHIKKDE